MSYTTDMYGEFKFDKPFDKELAEGINALCFDEEEEMNQLTQELFGEDAPSCWSPWVVSDDLTCLQPREDVGYMNHNDYYLEWLAFLYKHVFNHLCIRLTGSVTWKGEDWTNDSGQIEINNNHIEVKTWVRTNFEYEDVEEEDGEYLKPFIYGPFTIINKVWEKYSKLTDQS